MRTRVLMLAVLAAWGIAGCTTQKSLYSWGNYEQSLYQYYRNPDDVDGYIESLGEIIAAAEQEGKVPPGIYAEHGHALLTAGRGDEAAINFEKEKTLWPESSKLMDIMLENSATLEAAEKKKAGGQRLELPE